MANSTAAVRLTITAGSRSVSKTVSAPYNGLSEGVIDVPAGTLTATEFAIPFGGVAKATLLYVANNADKDLVLTINGSDPIRKIAPGGFECIAEADLPDDTELTAASLTTDDATVAAGTIDYFAAGDPV